jgi:hypothetical protein
MQQMSYSDYLAFSGAQAANKVEVCGVRIVTVQSDGSVAPDSEQIPGFDLTALQQDQRTFLQYVDFDVTEEVPTQVNVLDVIQDGRQHAQSGWVWPQDVAAFIKGQRAS